MLRTKFHLTFFSDENVATFDISMQLFMTVKVL